VVAAYYVIATAEASSNLARYDGVKYGHRTDDAVDLREMYLKTRSEGFGDEVKRRIMLGTFVLSSGYAEAYFHKATQVRQVIRDDLAAAFENVDIIITPTSPTAGIKLGEKIGDPLSMYLSDMYTVTANLTGSCAISLPCGYNQRGLPIGLQMIGKHFDEMTLLQVANRLEAELDLDIRVKN
jgi:aspartyl-tRNA(Asn)/glutamyl-tRNA(Gln) amidotransferase subunit A